MKINKEEIGKKYGDALQKVIDIRMQRKKLYGDTFLDDSLQFNALKIQDKIKRLLMNIENNNIVSKDKYENAMDSLLDICNYSLFAIAIIQKQNVHVE